MSSFTALALLCIAPLQAAAQTCASAPAPVVTLDYGSRYQDGDSSRSTIDAESNAAVNKALRPVDDFIRQLVGESNKALRAQAEADLDAAQERAACALSMMESWAEVGALSDLQSFSAKLSVGARITAFAEAYRQLRPFASDFAQTAQIDAWLKRHADAQITFWETEATEGARVGNLRAWAALGIDVIGEMTDTEAYRRWAALSAETILCTAREDGSLPQETKRGRYALHYQFHAVAPLVTLAARTPELAQSCDGALPRTVAFALTDYDAGGTASAEYSGKEQSYFDGTEKLQSHELAFLPALLTLFPESPYAARADATEGLWNSKLGGDQWLLWPRGETATK